MFADETGDTTALDTLPGPGLLAPPSCATPTTTRSTFAAVRLRTSEQIVIPAPSMPPASPPPSPPGVTFTGARTSIDCFTLNLNHNVDYWVTYDGGELQIGDVVIWTRAIPLSGCQAAPAAPTRSSILRVTSPRATTAVPLIWDSCTIVRLEGLVGNLEFHACIKKAGESVVNYRPDLVIFIGFEPPSAPPPPLQPPPPGGASQSAPKS